ncbi:hypothetical protein N7481_004869 [Penicillium waksmanii]|uniref:uncharacterized protein n=1 Tax=Penicillium waksmanii TaxID=69791 RepID=UPI0025479E6F|nr:uncharacterized protein N7481_004869 [Penicillium waksmanii]KAJ5989659.1 hypothetical protein N7481_004869 [Penicillium waksmanii]
MPAIEQDVQKSSLVPQGSVSQLESLAMDPSDEQVALHRSRILRKLDMRIVPLMLITYGLQFLDKALLGYAAVFTFRNDTHLQGQEYSWVGSIFYFGYMVFEYPLAGLLQSFSTSIYLGFFIFAWGICVVMTNFCVSFTGLMINRFVLGALESVVAPCFVVITGMFLSAVYIHPVLTPPAHWYTPKEQPIRQVLWFLGTPVFGIFGGLLGYALGNTHTEVASWRLLYIVFGSVTALWGIFFAYAFPASPEKASFLSEEDRVMSILSSHSIGHSVQLKWKWSQVKEAFSDLKTYIFFIIGIFNTIPAGSLSNFSSILLQGFGFTAVQTQLIGIPSHIVQIVSILIAYCVGNIIAPQCFRAEEEKEGYPTAIIAMVVSFGVLFIAPLALRSEFLYSKENKLRDAQAVHFVASSGSGYNMDLTDMENPNFRYAL